MSPVEEPRLCYIDDEGRQRELLLSTSAPRVVVGRSAKADVALTSDHEISLLHAVIEWMGTHWVIVDEDLSSNGTFVNGERLSGRRRLRPDDSIRVGDSLLTFHDVSDDDGETDFDASMPAITPPTKAENAVLVAMCRPFKHNPSFGSPASNPQIADELGIGIDTVKTHVRALFEKFGLENLPRSQKRTRLVERAMQSGIVTERDL